MKLIELRIKSVKYWKVNLMIHVCTIFLHHCFYLEKVSFLSMKNMAGAIAGKGKIRLYSLNNEPWAERSISRHCPIIFQLRHWILINPWARTASINLTPYRTTNRGWTDVLLDSRRLLQRLVEMLKLKGKKNDENRAIGHDTSERYESLFSFGRNNIGHFRNVLDLGARTCCLCNAKIYYNKASWENSSKSACPYFWCTYSTKVRIRANFIVNVANSLLDQSIFLYPYI